MMDIHNRPNVWCSDPPPHYCSKIFELEYGVVQFPRKIKNALLKLY